MAKLSVLKVLVLLLVANTYVSSNFHNVNSDLKYKIYKKLFSNCVKRRPQQHGTKTRGPEYNHGYYRSLTQHSYPASYQSPHYTANYQSPHHLTNYQPANYQPANYQHYTADYQHGASSYNVPPPTYFVNRPNGLSSSGSPHFGSAQSGHANQYYTSQRGTGFVHDVQDNFGQINDHTFNGEHVQHGRPGKGLRNFQHVAPPGLQQERYRNPPTFGSVGGDAPPTFGRVGGGAPPTFGSVGGGAPPTFGSVPPTFGSVPPTFGSVGGSAPPTFGSVGGSAPPTFGSVGGSAPPTFGSVGGTAPPTFGSVGGSAPPTFGSVGGSAPPTFGSIGGGAPPTFGSGDVLKSRTKRRAERPEWDVSFHLTEPGLATHYAVPVEDNDEVATDERSGRDNSVTFSSTVSQTG